MAAHGTKLAEGTQGIIWLSEDGNHVVKEFKERLTPANFEREVAFLRDNQASGSCSARWPSTMPSSLSQWSA